MSHLITGISSGLGQALAHHYLEQNKKVYGISRRGYPLPDSPTDVQSGVKPHGTLSQVKCDLEQTDSIEGHLSTLLDGVSHLDVVILNAGILGKIAKMDDQSIDELETVMRINVWSNKVILDFLLKREITVSQIVLISSGAAVNGGKGWGGYSLSKAALNMLAQLYSHEFPSSHLVSLAPGIIDTAMQALISDPNHVDVEQFPSFIRLRQARADGSMPSSDEAAARIISALPSLTEFASGSFVDIRDLN